MSLRRVVVTGVGAVTPLGVGAKQGWNRLRRGEIGIRPIVPDDDDDDVWQSLSSRVAGRVPTGSRKHEYDDAARFDRAEIRATSLGMRYGLTAAQEALEDAGWRPEAGSTAASRTAVCVGMAMVDLDYIADSREAVASLQSRQVSPYFVPRILPNLVAGHIAIKFGLTGPNHSVSTACATGAHAISDAWRLLAMDDADVAVAGGAEACVVPLAVAGFCRARALSTKFNDRPTEASRPFDKKRDGFVISEGAGILVLEELNHAVSRGADIYGEIIGCGLSGDADHITAGRADGAGALAAMRGAFRHVEGGIEGNIADLWYINAHATSTPKGDVAEVTAIQKLVKDRIEHRPFVSSFKGSLGHLLGAAGSVESIFALMALRNSFIPRNVNLETLEEGCDEYVEILLRDVEENAQKRRLVLKNSFGFGGTNVSLLFSNYLP